MGQKVHESINDALIDQLLEDPRYKIDNDGKIWTKLTLNGQGLSDDWREIGYKKKDGYVRIRYKDNFIFVQRVIYKKFHGDLDPTMTINHIDLNHANNHPNNLEQVTQAVNNQKKHKRYKKHKKAFLKDVVAKYYDKYKQFHEQKYPFVQKVKVIFPGDPEPFYDEIKGLNKGHALQRAKLNWQGAEIEPINVIPKKYAFLKIVLSKLEKILERELQEGVAKAFGEPSSSFMVIKSGDTISIKLIDDKTTVLSVNLNKETFKMSGLPKDIKENIYDLMEKLRFREDSSSHISSEIEGYFDKFSVLIQKHNDSTNQTEWALVSPKDHNKVLEWYGAKKPSDERVKKTEKRVRWFKHKGSKEEIVKKVILKLTSQISH